MRHVLSILYTTDLEHFDQVIDFHGTPVRFTQYSVNFDFKLTMDLIEKYDGLCDAISISGLPPLVKCKWGSISHPTRDKLLKASTQTPIVDGQSLKEIYIPWILRKYFFKYPHLVSKKKIGCYAALLQKGPLEILQEFSKEMILMDPYFFSHLPFSLKTIDSVERYLKYFAPILKVLPLRPSVLPTFDTKKPKKILKEFFDSDVMVANMATLELIDLHHLQGKTLIVDVLDEKNELKLKAFGVQNIVVLLPQNPCWPFINFAIMESFLQAVYSSGEVLGFDDLLERVEELNLSPHLISIDQ